MNKIFNYFLLFFIFLIFKSYIHSVDWEIEVVDSESWVNQTLDMDLDSNDYPHIVYRDWHDLMYSYWDGDEWIIERLDPGFTLSDNVSIAIDRDDNIHISFTPYDGFSMYYGFYDHNQWSFEEVYSNSWPSTGEENCISVDSQNRPHISFLVEHYSSSVGYAYFDGIEWEVEMIDTGPLWLGLNTSIDVDIDDNPHIIYDDEKGNPNIKYAYFDGLDWYIEVIESAVCDGLSRKCVSVDSLKHPHISFHGVGRNIRYAYYDGNDWLVETVDYKGDVGESNSIDVDSNNNPHISYEDDTNNALKYAYYDSSEWYVETVDDMDIIYAQNSIATNEDDRAVIAYRRDNGEDLKIARRITPNSINLTTFSADAKGDSAIVLNWSIETTEGEVIEGFNLYRREMGLTHSTIHQPVSEDTYPRWKQINSHPITGQNPYTYIDDTVESGITYEYQLEAIVEDAPEILGTTTGKMPVPQSFAITSIHPNPATDIASITLTTPQPTDVVIEVYDITGRRVLVEEVGSVESGEHTHRINISDLSSGVYSVSAIAGTETDTGRMVVVR